MLTIIGIKFILSIQNNYEKLSRENPKSSFLALLPMTLSAVAQDFIGACCEWVEWLGSLVLSGTTTTKMKKIVNEVDETEQANQLRDEVADWDLQGHEVFQCPLTLAVLQRPRFVEGFAFERDVIVPLAENHKLNPLTRKPMSISQVERNEDFEKYLHRYIILRLSEQARQQGKEMLDPEK